MQQTIRLFNVLILARLGNINTWVGIITFCKNLNIYQGGEKLVGQVSTQRPRPRPQYQDQVKRHKE